MDLLEDLIAAFRSDMEPHVGRKVSVWLVRLDRPYVGGELLRLADEGLIVAGHGVVVYDQIDKVGVDGQTIRFARPLG